MLDHELKQYITTRILPTVQTPGQYVGGELHSVRKDHGTVAGTVCLAFPDTYTLGMSHHGLQVLYSLMNAGDWACERAFTPLARLRGRPAAARHAALQPGDVHAAEPVRRARFHAAVRALLHERADDARPGRHPPACRGTGSGRHAGDRRRARVRRTPSCSRRSSTCSSSATARRACRRSARCGSRNAGRRPLSRDDKLAAHRRRRAPWAYVPRFYRAGLRRAAGSRSAIARTARRRARGDPRRASSPTLDAIPLPTRPIVPIRRDGARPDRHRDHARLPLAVPVLPEHVIKRPLRAPLGRDDRRRRRSKSYRNTGLRRDQPAVALDQRLPALRGTGQADERGLHAPGREDLAAEPADHRDLEEDPRPASRKAAQRADAGPGGRPRRHARADPQADQQRGPLRRLPRGFRAWAGGG